MQKPQFPYDLSRSSITQKFHDKHRAWDIVPLYKRADGKPADCLPVFSGERIKINDTDPILGKGIKVRTKIWPHLNEYLNTFGISGTNLDILYWHFLDVTDEDIVIEQNVPVGITGNTGYVWSYLYSTPDNPMGVVPDNMKGVAPYPGLHLHLVTEVDGVPIDPDIIFNYQPKYMIELINSKGTYYLCVKGKPIYGYANIDMVRPLIDAGAVVTNKDLTGLKEVITLTAGIVGHYKV